MGLQLVKAARKQAFMKLGIAAPSGGGKTLGALLVAYGLMKEKYPKLKEDEIWEKIAIIDTENGSGQLYANYDVPKTSFHVGSYLALTLNPPFEAEKYINAIELCESNNVEVCIIDSTSHLWSGEGGLLEQQSNIAKRSGNSYTAWRDVTPMHNKFVEKMLQTPMHIIATMRSKQEYVQEKNTETGKTTVRKIGLEPEQRKGMEFEFTVFFEINNEHDAFGSKDRTSMFDQKTFKITPDVGKQIMAWLETADASDNKVIAQKEEPAEKMAALAHVKEEIVALCKEVATLKNRETAAALVRKYTPDGKENPNMINDEDKLVALREELEQLITVLEQSVVSEETVVETK